MPRLAKRSKLDAMVGGRRERGQQRRGRRRLSRLELGVGAAAALVLGGLGVLEPAILEAPFENGRTLAFTIGVAAITAAALAAMVHAGVPPVARLAIVGVPAAAVTWWLVSPFFVDVEVDERFDASLRAAAPVEDASGEPLRRDGEVNRDAPSLLGRGSFVGLAGHRGTGDAGFFRLPDGARVLRLENLDIQNGPDLRLYVVPGDDARTPRPGSLYLGRLRGNVGNQTYQMPGDSDLTAGSWTVLVWCEAFDVEFVAANVAVTGTPT